MIKLEQLKAILQSNDSFYLGHGIGRAGDSNEIMNSIFKNGLRTKDNSLYYTTIGLDTDDLDRLQNKLNHWSHFESKKIILIRLPLEYVNCLGDSADLDGERYGAFYTEKISENGNKTYYLDPKFIIGCYDVNYQGVILNPRFEDVLSNKSIEILKQNYKKTLEKMKVRFQKQSEFLKQFRKLDVSSDFVDVSYDVINDFGDDIEWDDFTK